MALTDKLTDIADAIRAKTGGTAKLSLEQMPGAIAGISGGGGTCDKPHIIEVTELPTENIDKNAVYLCGGAYYKGVKEFLDVIVVYGGETTSFKELNIEYSTPYGFYIIPTKTTEGIFSSSDGMYFYYIEDEGGVFNYIDGAWEDTGFPIVSDATEATENGEYAIITTTLQQMTISKGEIVITENGTYNIADKASAIVSVPNAAVVGIWRLNDTIDWIPSSKLFLVDYVTKEMDFCAFGFENDDGCEVKYIYNIDGGVWSSAGGYDNGKWTNTEYKIVDFGTEGQAVLSEFKEWLTANATPIYTITQTE